MADSLDGAIEQLTKLREAIRAEESRREELMRENREAEKQLAESRAELAEQAQRLDAAQQLVEGGSGSEVLCLDVGGRIFKVYGSTLSLFKESVLAMIVGKMWADGVRQKDGSLFLDMDPDAFQEILSFLRERRIDLSAKSSFSRRAADLAAYLRIPVDHVKGAEKLVAKFPRMGEVQNNALTFDIYMPHPARGYATALTFSVSGATSGTLYTKAGTYKDALANREAWTESWCGSLGKGSNRIPLDLQLRNGVPMAIYIVCPEADIMYSNEGRSPRGGTTDHPEVNLLCTPGRASDVPFMWPPSQQLHLARDHRYFAGEIEYTLYAG